MSNLKALSMLVAVGTVGMLTAPSAHACVWALGSTAAPNTMLGASFTQAGAAAPGTTCASSLTLTANGVNTGVGPNPPQLFNKQDGAGEMGIGLTNDPIVGENEVTPGSSIIIDVSHVIGRTGPMVLSVDAGSVQSPDAWELLGSAGEVLVPANSSMGEMMFTTSDTLLTFTATVGNVLLASFDSPEQTISGPEPATLALLGTALVGFGFFRCRRS